jgi:hypothetical protein
MEWVREGLDEVVVAELDDQARSAGEAASAGRYAYSQEKDGL